jgi:hypothetical protein
MKNLGLLLVFAACLGLATRGQAATNPSAEQVKKGCETYIAAKSTGKCDTADHLKQGEGCFTYIKGVVDEMEGELAWGDDSHTKLVMGNWSGGGIATDQALRVFVKYANDNPITLNKPATAVLRQSMEAAGLYVYSPVAIGNGGNGAAQ